jgi:DNA-binding NarL/FixJ family response regulator
VRLEVNLPRPKAPAAPEGSAPAAPPPTPAPSPAPRDDSTIRVLLADDHKLLREGLASLLKGEHGIEVVGHASNGREAVDLASKLHPDVVVMDISMPQLDGIEATRAITANGYAGRVIGLSMHEAYEMKARMIAAGAVTALRKDGPSHEFIAAIRHSSPQRT